MTSATPPRGTRPARSTRRTEGAHPRRGTRLPPATANRVFRTVLAALSRPGSVHRLPEHPAPPALLPVLALADLDTGVCVLGGDQGWAGLVRTATGAPSVPLPDARLVAVLDPPTPEMLLRARRGTAEAPETGALLTVVAAPTGRHALLTGPGVDGTARVPMALSSALVEARREVVAARPAGVDLLLVGPAGALVGIPRGVRVELEAS